MLRRELFANAALPLLLFVKLIDPAPDGAFAKLHVFAHLSNTQALDFDHLRHLELEVRVKGSSGFLLVHFYRRLGLKKPSLCLFKLDHCIRNVARGGP